MPSPRFRCAPCARSPDDFVTALLQANHFELQRRRQMMNFEWMGRIKKRRPFTAYSMHLIADASPDDASNDQIRIVEGSAISVRKGIAQFATLIDRPGSFRGDVAGYAAGNENCLNSFFIPSSSGEMSG